METVTLEKLLAFGSVNYAIEWAKQQYGSYPIKPDRPILSKNHTVDDALKYASDLKEYEEKKLQYDSLKEAYNEHNRTINNVIVDYIKDVSGLNTVVPKQYRDKVYSYAWQESHSNGYHEVYLTLIDLVEIFEQ